MSEGISAEFRERLGLSAFTGETLENFERCTRIENGLVIYDKSLLPEAEHRETWQAQGDMKFPLRKAILKAIELGHTPSVIEASLSRIDYLKQMLSSGKWITLPEGTVVPVSSVWIPKDDAWRKIDLSIPIKHPREFLVRRNPVEVLQEMQRY